MCTNKLLAAMASSLVALIAPLSTTSMVHAQDDEICASTQYFTPAVSPGVYLVNFAFLYVANPDLASMMPAYRVAVPSELVECLYANPDGCPYLDFIDLLDDPILGGPDCDCSWASACQVPAEYLALLPPIAVSLDQVNQPLGRERADEIAAALGLNASMEMTQLEYLCTIAHPVTTTPVETPFTIYECIRRLTNSEGNAPGDIPLSSYGLSLAFSDGTAMVQSVCAPNAPCILFNELFAGQLESIAIECGWFDKFLQLVDPAQTSFLEMVQYGNQCQETADGRDLPCLLETRCGICPADLNHDQVVDGADLNMLIGNWGEAGVPEDITGDGIVDAADITVLLGEWGDCD